MELFSPGHLIVMAIVVAVLFFGWKQLPDMSRALGRSLRIFKTEIKGMSEDDRARETARDEARDEPRAIEAPRADVVRNESHSADTHSNGTHSTGTHNTGTQSTGTHNTENPGAATPRNGATADRPRPAPSPTGQPRTPAPGA